MSARYSNDIISALQARRIAHITDEEAQLWEFARRELLRHLKLLELVAREDHQPLDAWVALQNSLDESTAERAGAAGDEDGLLVEHRGACLGCREMASRLRRSLAFGPYGRSKKNG